MIMIKCKGFFCKSKVSLILTSKISGWSEDLAKRTRIFRFSLLLTSLTLLFEGTEIGQRSGIIFCPEDEICMLDFSLGLIVWYFYLSKVVPCHRTKLFSEKYNSIVHFLQLNCYIEFSIHVAIFKISFQWEFIALLMCLTLVFSCHICQRYGGESGVLDWISYKLFDDTEVVVLRCSVR